MAKRIEISPEQRKQCLELHEQHWPNTKIGKRVGLDRRVVKKVVLEAEEARRFQEMSNARRDVAGAYLKEHIQLLEDVSRCLLELTLPPILKSKLGDLVTDVRTEMRVYLVNTKVKWRLITTMGHQIEEDYSDSSRTVVLRTIDREIESAIGGLEGHIPKLREWIRTWEKIAGSYNEKLQELLGKSGVASNLGIPEELIESGILSAVKIISEKGINEKEPIPRYSPAHKGSIDPGEQLLQIAEIRQQMKGLLPLVNDLNEMYRQLEDILSPSQLRRQLMISRCKDCPVP